MSPACRKTDLNAMSLETVSRAAFHRAPVCARVWGQPPYMLGNDGKQLLNFRCSKGMNGEELFIRSCPCALKLKLKYKEGDAPKTSPLLMDK